MQVCQHAVEQDLPDVAQQDAADQVGHKVDGTEDVGALDAAGQHDCNGKGADVDEHGGDHSERCRKAESVQEGGILEHGDIVLDAHKGGLAHGGEALEGKEDAPDKGPDKADDERDQRRKHEHRPIFADGLLHDIPPKQREAGEQLARLPLRFTQIKGESQNRLAVSQLVLLGPAINEGSDNGVPIAGACCVSGQSRTNTILPFLRRHC